ncbi:tetratricopeptide repeat protein [Motiliproteus sp. SC1-56]|uniref:response regulator n=1 Tax=Motiliproteus sp. SC1-56 TaxID=2799565 RepID=UPI001A8EB601|nr:tetratricopeptide repeat protein [Motiliproteus sp. SC1-56]
MATKYNWSRLRFLIVDDLPNFCSALRAMVTSYGVQEVDVARSGDEAVSAISKTKYDVILCDYNLGEGRNGNDILEESKVQGLLKGGALFVMITAESAAEMVRGALEYQPDDYLTKPFTKEVLQTRLERLLERTHCFKPLYQAKKKGTVEEAIAQCDQLQSQYPRYRGYALKIKSELLMENEEYARARELFTAVLAKKPIAWARLGLGKTYFYEGDYDQARAAFDALVQEDRGYVQAWDWLARCQEQLGDTEAAQASLQEAVKISPINVRRQAQLGELALKNNDLERAEMAYNRTVKIGKHSVFRSPDNYLRLTEILANRLDEADALTSKRMETKALGTMEELRQLYRGNPEVTLKSRLAEHHLYTTKGASQEAAKALHRAYEVCAHDEEGTLPAHLKERLIEHLEEKGQTHLAEQLVSAMQQEESSHNLQAVELYDQGDLDGALKMLKLAVKEKPRSFSICLNTAQVAMHWMVKNGIDAELMALAGDALERTSAMEESDKRYKLYSNLKARYQKLQQRVGAAS